MDGMIFLDDMQNLWHPVSVLTLWLRILPARTCAG